MVVDEASALPSLLPGERKKLVFRSSIPVGFITGRQQGAAPNGSPRALRTSLPHFVRNGYSLRASSRVCQFSSKIEYPLVAVVLKYTSDTLTNRINAFQAFLAIW